MHHYGMKNLLKKLQKTGLIIYSNKFFVYRYLMQESNYKKKIKTAREISKIIGKRPRKKGSSCVMEILILFILGI